MRLGEAVMEKRRFPRLKTSLPIGYHVSCPESGELWSGQGLLKNISIGGIYFTCEEPLPLKVGHIRDFVFDPAMPPRVDYDANLALRGKVVRIEKPGLESAPFGIAVQFVHPLMRE
jgi:hypothetical protein